MAKKAPRRTAVGRPDCRRPSRRRLRHRAPAEPTDCQLPDSRRVDDADVRARLFETSIVGTSQATFSGDFYLQSLALGAEQADAITFTATLESAGAVTVAVAPYNTVAPAITGTTTVGQTLTTTNGTWAGDATITYARQWQRGNNVDPNDPSWANIASATNLTYVLQSADSGKRIRCQVTATNSQGSIVAFSNIVGPVS